MCFQGYAHWLCGHTSLYEDFCEEALALDLPLHVKISCPNYQISTRSPQRFCGTGHFYCAQTPEGIELDHMHAAHEFAIEEIARIELQLYAEGGLRARGKEIGNAILRNGGGKEDCEKDERIREIFEEVGWLTKELVGIKHREQELKNRVERARMLLSGPGPGAPPLAPELYPSNLQGAMRRPRGLANLGSRGQRLRDFSAGQHESGGQQHGQYSAGFPSMVPYTSGQYLPGQHQTGEHQNGQYSAGVPPMHQHPNVQYWPAQHQTRGHQVRQSQPWLSRSESHTRWETPLDLPQVQPSRKKREKEKEASPERSSTPVRRSSRVRTKRVTYAESEPDLFSRPASPVKSDAADFNFSPSKEAASEDKAQIGRSSSLVDKISDWQKRDLTKTLQEPLQQALPYYLANVSPIPKPEKREWNVNRYDVDAKIPSQNILPHTGQEWKVNRYDADLALPSPPIHQEAPQPKSGDYASLRQSFSSTANLAPPLPLPHHAYSEPQKRRLPAPSSTAEGSNKKMKLALAGNPKFLTMTAFTQVPSLAPMEAGRKSFAGEKHENGDGEEAQVQEDVTALEASRDVDSEAESELSEIDWDILEEGVLVD